MKPLVLLNLAALTWAEVEALKRDGFDVSDAYPSPWLTREVRDWLAEGVRSIPLPANFSRFNP